MDFGFTRKTTEFATKNHLGNSFLFHKKEKFECIRKNYLICNEKPLRKFFLFKKKRNFECIRKNYLICNEKPLRKLFFISQKEILNAFEKPPDLQRKTTWEFFFISQKRKV